MFVASWICRLGGVLVLPDFLEFRIWGKSGFPGFRGLHAFWKFGLFFDLGILGLCGFSVFHCLGDFRICWNIGFALSHDFRKAG